MARTLKASSRARGGTRGGCGGGYEITDPDYDEHRLARMKRELASLSCSTHRALYLQGVSRYDRAQLEAWLKSHRI